TGLLTTVLVNGTLEDHGDAAADVVATASATPASRTRAAESFLKVPSPPWTCARRSNTSLGRVVAGSEAQSPLASTRARPEGLQGVRRAWDLSGRARRGRRLRDRARLRRAVRAAADRGRP